MIESGEFGKRDNKIEMLGFEFRTVKKEKFESLQVIEDRVLKKMALNWTPSKLS